MFCCCRRPAEAHPVHAPHRHRHSKRRQHKSKSKSKTRPSARGARFKSVSSSSSRRDDSTMSSVEDKVKVDNGLKESQKEKLHTQYVNVSCEKKNVDGSIYCANLCRLYPNNGNVAEK